MNSHNEGRCGSDCPTCNLLALDHERAQSAGESRCPRCGSERIRFGETDGLDYAMCERCEWTGEPKEVEL